MAYGQRNYPKTIQGIRGRYTVAQIGCLLTAFCNLSLRFGDRIGPDKLNTEFVKRGIYVDIDDGIRDDLGWYSLTSFNKSIVVQNVGYTSMPPSKNSIVRIKADNRFGTHFCLVDHIAGNHVYIVDSWDGNVKRSDEYGPITGWATYSDKTPILKVKPIPKAAKPTYVTVKKGQYLSLIARLNYITLGRLLALNPSKKHNPNFVKVGEKIRVK